jgi:very-short-patch-repair endonuclease
MADRYYCLKCKAWGKINYISKDEYYETFKLFSKPLCSKHRPTPVTIKLGNLLKDRSWGIEFEKPDGFKWIDIAVVEAKVNIEVDGPQHNTDPDQALTDLHRTYHSFKEGYFTLRVPNCLMENEETIQKTANRIHDILTEVSNKFNKKINGKTHICGFLNSLRK